MKARVLIGAVSALLVSAVAVSVALSSDTLTPTKFQATLNIRQEVPKETGAPAMAAGKFTASLVGSKLHFTLTFSHLTGPATAAHIHLGKINKSGPVMIPLCGPCKSPVTGSASVTHAELNDILAGMTYVNVHTAKNPNGEIRGQLG